MSGTLSDTSIISLAPEQLSCELDGVIAILNFSKGHYYGLDGVGARIWELLQEPRSVADIREKITAEYEVDSDRCREDLIKLLKQLLDAGLAEVQSEA